MAWIVCCVVAYLCETQLCCYCWAVLLFRVGKKNALYALAFSPLVYQRLLLLLHLSTVLSLSYCFYSPQPISFSASVFGLHFSARYFTLFTLGIAWKPVKILWLLTVSELLCSAFVHFSSKSAKGRSAVFTHDAMLSLSPLFGVSGVISFISLLLSVFPKLKLFSSYLVLALWHAHIDSLQTILKIGRDWWVQESGAEWFIRCSVAGKWSVVARVEFAREVIFHRMTKHWWHLNSTSGAQGTAVAVYWLQGYWILTTANVVSYSQRHHGCHEKMQMKHSHNGMPEGILTISISSVETQLATILLNNGCCSLSCFISSEHGHNTRLLAWLFSWSVASRAQLGCRCTDSAICYFWIGLVLECLRWIVDIIAMNASWQHCRQNQ